MWKDVYEEMYRRRIALIRLRVLDGSLSSATFYYDNDPWQTITFEPPHRCDCEFCDRNVSAELAWLDGCENDPFVEWLDELVADTSHRRWHPQPEPSLFCDTPVVVAPVESGDYTITVYRDREHVSVEDGCSAPLSDQNWQTYRFTERYARNQPRRYRVTLTLMGGTRVETQVVEATDPDEAIELAEQGDPNDWETVEESWTDSDVDVTVEDAV